VVFRGGPFFGYAAHWFASAVRSARARAPREWRLLVWCAVVFPLIGLIAIPFPQILGNGKGLALLGFDSNLTVGVAATLMLLKTVATIGALRRCGVDFHLPPYIDPCRRFDTGDAQCDTTRSRRRHWSSPSNRARATRWRLIRGRLWRHYDFGRTDALIHTNWHFLEAMLIRGTMLQNKKIIERRRFSTLSLLKIAAKMMAIAMLCGPVHSMERRHGVLVGTVIDVRSAAKTAVVKTADGTEHTLLFTGHTAVHGSTDVARGTEDAFHGVEKGSKVAVHYTDEGGKETADEVDRIGDDSFKAVKVTAIHLDRGAKTTSVKTADGAVDTFRITGRASEEIGEGVAKGSEDTAKGIIYFTDEGGHKVVHFFERAI
jgi:hypothetical protein